MQSAVAGAPQVTVVGETAVLRGVVASTHARDLAEQMVRLEPGIWNVRNELQVAGQPETPVPQPATAPLPPPSSTP
ncbi:MAG: BON domain-containing protein [Pirellulales bacterium]